MCAASRFVIGLCLVIVSVSTFANADPIDLRCEGLIEPAGIDTPQPMLCWKLSADAKARSVRPVAYQVVVASSVKQLSDGQGDLWDSGRVETDRLDPIAYAGKALQSGQRCFWSVRTWTSDQPRPAASRPAEWTMGLLKPGDWDAAKWISDGRPASEQESILLRRAFTSTKQVTRATLFVTGLGQYEVSINGDKIGNGLLAPGWTDYRKTVLYDTFDVTSQLHIGDNAIAIMLGNGMYNIKPTPGRYVKFTHSFGPLKAIALLRLEYGDGTSEAIGTDKSWAVLPSPITYCNIFGGEDEDPRRLPSNWSAPAFDANACPPAAEIDGPGGVLRGHSASAPTITAIASYAPVSAKVLRPTVTVYDLAQNGSHMPRLTVHGPAGSVVRIIPSELLGPDGAVDRASCVQDAGGPAWWQYTLAGTGSERYFPKFFYQGCRYLQVECFPAAPDGKLPTVDAIEGVVVHSSAEPIGSFECSNELFSKTYDLVRWAQRSNMMSLMTDCPHREKLGWLEELHLNGPSLRYNFRLDRLYAKAMNDMADAQLPGGLVPNIAPEYFLAHTDKLDDPFRNSVEWGSSFIIAAWQQYQFTGDHTLVRDYYPKMLKYHAFLDGMAKEGIIGHGLGDWYDIGPKPPWGSQLTPPPFTATAIYYYDTCVLVDVAKMLGKTADVTRLTLQAEQIKTAFNKTFFDAKNGRYATGSQCTSAMPLVLGLVPDQIGRDAALQTLIDDIRSRGNALSAGDVGYRYVLRALADAGRSDVIFEMNNQSARPGYGMQIARGATSLTEKWDASVGSFGSQNHFMLGQINEWFFHDLAGIQSDPADPGFAKIVIKPAPVGDITRVAASYESVRGRIVSEWINGPAGLTLKVTIPPGTTATVYVPSADANSVREGAGVAAAAPGVQFLRAEAGAAVFAVGSGSYVFSSTLPPGRPTGVAASTTPRAVVLAWTPVANAESYQITRTSGTAKQPVTLARSVAANTFTDDSVTVDQTYQYTVNAIAGGVSGPGTLVSATPQFIQNAGFEQPTLAGEQYAPAGVGWAFTPAAGPSGSGIAGSRSAFLDKHAPPPAGRQVAFLQGTSTISQVIAGLTPNTTYQIAFMAAQRTTYNRGGQTWQVQCDGKSVSTFSPPQTATGWKEYSARFTAAADSHTLAFVGTNERGGDNTVLFDNVCVTPVLPNGH